MWNPPWTLTYIVPFGYFNFATGQILWLVFHVSLFFFSAQELWQIYGSKIHPRRLSWILVYSFVPAIFVLIIGQITPLILAGLTSFLYAERKQNSWVMGASLAILSIKPHILYLFWIIVCFWIFYGRQWSVIYAAVLIGLVTAILPLLFNREVYTQYFALFGVNNIVTPMDWPAPTLRNVLRLFLGFEQPWLQFAPTVVAVVWALFYWQSHMHVWRWRDHLPLIVLVSVFSNFFVWTYDQVVILPAVIEAAVWLRQNRFPWHRYWTPRIYIAINCLHAVLRIWLAEELWYFWLAPALLVNYLIFRSERKWENKA